MRARVSAAMTKMNTKSLQRLALLVCLGGLFGFEVVTANESPGSTYGSLVDENGNIRMPDDFQRDWSFLGTWSLAKEDVDTSSAASGHGAAGLHNVYTQKESVDYFREHGKFPDGAVIIKELLATATAPMTTGTVSRGTAVEGWFVMVKDTQGRFASNPLWGDGWGWALFGAGNSDSPVTKDYKTECLGCHIPARKDDWIYLDGYPHLSGAERLGESGDDE